MTALADAKHAQVDIKVREALAQALGRGALPGESEELDETALADAATFLARTAAGRRPGHSAVAIETLGEGATGRFMRIAIVNDDMPFLVDSIANALARADIAIHRLLHPVLSVERSGEGALTAILGDEAPGARRESMIYIETDRADAKARRTLEKALAETLADVRAAVQDWSQMQSAMAADADMIPDEEGAALLRWFLARHFTQTGHEIVHRDGSASKPLGICTRHDRPLIAPASLEAAFVWFEEGKRTPLIIKASRLSRVHRNVLLDLVIVPVREGREVKALSIHAGMWTSSGLAATPDKVPLLRSALSSLMDKFGFDPQGHAGKTLAHALTALPHDITIGFDRETLERLALTFMSLSDRPRPKLALATSPLARHLYAFVWLPRDELSTARRVSIQDMLALKSSGTILSWSIALEEGGLALLRITLDLREGGVVPDDVALDRMLKQMVRGWIPAVEEALATTEDAGRAAALAQRYAGGFPLAYRNGAGPEEAAIDIRLIHGLAGDGDKSIRIYRNVEDNAERLRLKLYSHATIALSDVVPAFENFGFRVIEEMTTPIDNGALGHVQRFVLELPAGADAEAVVGRADVVTEAIAQVMEGRAENDRFNELIVTAGLSPRSVVLFRALYRYLRQAGVAYGMATFAETLRKAQGVATNLVTLFEALHDPAAQEGAADRIAAAKAEIDAGLEQVTAIDEDRVLRLLRAVITATLRTNFFAEAAQEALAFKLDSAQVPGLPAPLPWREIWVYSPRVEGIHLRAGPVARGGLRWSDRRDDFRTEILGLMKAQRVKNAVIVPTGAKGGFYPKQLPNPQADRDAWLAEGTESYRIFIRALLSVTDNIVKNKVKHPSQVVVHDGDDPYFVVAADKGTATFSDTANGLAHEAGFWLDDAFASGGSAGYDHKKMGITARGAWETVKRHFREMDTDIQTTPFTVAGVGDMSGDVFGNGMLLSEKIRLIAAFDHRDIFIDPDPDTDRSFAERKRLFELPRSSWQDYDRSALSAGAMIISRAEKSVTLTPEAVAAIGIDKSVATPFEIMTAILKAPTDLLWFGGIGTYIKAAVETNAEVGDRANDPIRVNATELRAKVIGEGANLGITQKGRIAYALSGGRCNSDAIDNSAGVNSSDVEVNIKIALASAVNSGRLTMPKRNQLLASMTPEVAQLVLRNNYLQSLAISLTERLGLSNREELGRLMSALEATGQLNRKVETLPNNAEFSERYATGKPLTRPEIGVLLSYAKLTLFDALVASTLPDEPYLQHLLVDYFPAKMQKNYADDIKSHRLHREIVATALANAVVNRGGPGFVQKLADASGLLAADVVKAAVIVEDGFGLKRLWSEVDALDGKIGGEVQNGLYATITRIFSDASRLYLQTGSAGAATGDMATEIERLKTAIKTLSPAAAKYRRELGVTEIDGVPSGLLEELDTLSLLVYVPEIMRIAESAGTTLARAAESYATVSSTFRVARLLDASQRITPADHYESLALLRSQDQISSSRRRIVVSALTEYAKEKDPVQAWYAADRVRVNRIVSELGALSESGDTNLARLTVAAGLLGDIVQAR